MGKRGNPGHRWTRGESGNPQRRWKTGRSGNPRGRPKGARRKLNEEFLADFLEAWRVCGKQLIADAMAKYPDVLLYVCSTLVPADERSNTKPMIDDDMVLAARFLAAKSEINSAAIAERPSSGEHRAPVACEETRLASYRRMRSSANSTRRAPNTTSVC